MKELNERKCGMVAKKGEGNREEEMKEVKEGEGKHRINEEYRKGRKKWTE